MDRQLSAGDGARSGAKWMGVARIGMQVGQFGFLILNARLLAPEEFGVAAVAIALIALAEVFTDIGLAAAIVQARVATARLLNTAFWLSLAAGLGVALLIAALAVPAASFYDEPELLPLLLYTAVGFALTRGSVQTAILERTYRYRRLAVVEASSFLIGATATPVLAVLGAGASALVIGALLQIVLRSVFLWLAVPWKPTMRPSRADAAALWRYSRGLVGFNLLNHWAMRNVDTLILGRAVSAASLGEYSRAYNLMMVPVRQTSLVLGRVLFPSLSRLAESRQRVADAWVRGMAAAAMLTMPLAVTMAATAQASVVVLFGERWSGMAPELALLSLAGLPQTLSASTGAVYRAIDMTGELFRRGIYTTIVAVALFVVGALWGTDGVAAAWIVNACLGLWIMAAPLMRALDMGARSLQPLVAPVVAAVGTGAAELAVLGALGGDASPLVTLTLQGAAGLTAFLVILWRLDHPAAGLVLSKLRRRG